MGRAKTRSSGLSAVEIIHAMGTKNSATMPAKAMKASADAIRRSMRRRVNIRAPPGLDGASPPYSLRGFVGFGEEPQLHNREDHQDEQQNHRCSAGQAHLEEGESVLVDEERDDSGGAVRAAVRDHQRIDEDLGGKDDRYDDHQEDRRAQQWHRDV